MQFDILFSSVDEPRNIMKNLMKSPENVVKNLRCETSTKSLLGFVSCQNIVRNVPSKATFELVLRAVRFWAMQRGIYSVNAGYLGGITLAVMVAKVC